MWGGVFGKDFDSGVNGIECNGDSSRGHDFTEGDFERADFGYIGAILLSQMGLLRLASNMVKPGKRCGRTSEEMAVLDHTPNVSWMQERHKLMSAPSTTAIWICMMSYAPQPSGITARKNSVMPLMGSWDVTPYKSGVWISSSSLAFSIIMPVLQ